MVEKDLPVLLEYQVNLDLLEQKEEMEFQEHQALKEDREKKETQDYRDFLVYQERTVPMYVKNNKVIFWIKCMFKCVLNYVSYYVTENFF